MLASGRSAGRPRPARIATRCTRWRGRSGDGKRWASAPSEDRNSQGQALLTVDEDEALGVRAQRGSQLAVESGAAGDALEALGVRAQRGSQPGDGRARCRAPCEALGVRAQRGSQPELVELLGQRALGEALGVRAQRGSQPLQHPPSERYRHGSAGRPRPARIATFRSSDCCVQPTVKRWASAPSEDRNPDFTTHYGRRSYEALGVRAQRGSQLTCRRRRLLRGREALGVRAQRGSQLDQGRT